MLSDTDANRLFPLGESAHVRVSCHMCRIRYLCDASSKVIVTPCSDDGTVNPGGGGDGNFAALVEGCSLDMVAACTDEVYTLGR